MIQSPDDIAEELGWNLSRLVARSTLTRRGHQMTHRITA